MINTKEQTVLDEIIDAFEGGNMETQSSVLDYRIDLYFHDYNLAMEKDECGHNQRNIDDEIKKQKAML